MEQANSTEQASLAFGAVFESTGTYFYVFLLSTLMHQNL